MHDLQNYSKRMLSAGEFRAASERLIGDGCRGLVKRASVKDELELQLRHHTKSTFWASQSAVCFYAIVVLAVLTRRLWILHCLSIMILDQILQVVVKWLIFTLDDRELRFASNYIRTWLALIIREGEKTLTSQSAYNFAVATSLLQSAPTGVSYAKWVVRYKRSQMRREFLREGVGRERYAGIRIALATKKKAQQAQAAKGTISRSSTGYSNDF